MGEKLQSATALPAHCKHNIHTYITDTSLARMLVQLSFFFFILINCLNIQTGHTWSVTHAKFLMKLKMGHSERIIPETKSTMPNLLINDKDK